MSDELIKRLEELKSNADKCPRERIDETNIQTYWPHLNLAMELVGNYDNILQALNDQRTLRRLVQHYINLGIQVEDI